MINRMKSPIGEIDMIAKLADLKQSHYHSTLLVHAVIELLVEKNLISKQELVEKVQSLDEFRPVSHNPKR